MPYLVFMSCNLCLALQGANQELMEGRREGLNEHLLDAMGLQAKKTITNLSGREFV